MQKFPHLYHASASAEQQSDISLDSDQLPTLVSGPPPEFGGPGGQWSPETLLCATIADCFILTFRAIARHSDFAWQSLSVKVDGTLDRADRTIRFTHFKVAASLTVSAGSDTDKADRLLHKAENSCLISNSLFAEFELLTEINGAGG